MASTFDANNLPVISGYLVKQGGGSSGLFSRKSWKRRFFLLGAGELSYFETDNSNQPIKSIPLSTVSVVSKTRLEGREHCFEVVTPRRTWYMSATTDQDMQRWIDGLKTHVNFFIHERELQAQHSEAAKKAANALPWEHTPPSLTTPPPAPVRHPHPGSPPFDVWK